MRETVVTIEKLANGGAGFGRVDGKACFVPFTAPGDVARVRVTAEKRSYIEGEPIELLEPSHLRVTPTCPVFGICGGCNWQHLAYSAQIKEKEEIFAELLWRSGRVERKRILPVIPAQEPYGYRSRIQLKVRFVDGKPHLGFFRTKSHDVIDIPETCAIAHADINRVIGKLRQLLQHLPEPDTVPQIDVARGDDGRVIVIVHYTGTAHVGFSEFLHEQNELLGFADGIFIQGGHKSNLGKVFGIESLSYQIPENFIPGCSPKRLSFGKGGFSQVNYQQNLQLIQLVWNWAELTGKEKVLDLYCGNGNFTIPLAGFAESMVGFEEFAPSIDDARHNRESNNVMNAEFYCSDATLEVKKLAAAGESFDVVLLDPPRCGAAEVVGQIHAINPHFVLYVSCDPATLARDIGILKKNNYEVVKCQPVDMFPQTYHIESVTLLKAV